MQEYNALSRLLRMFRNNWNQGALHVWELHITNEVINGKTLIGSVRINKQIFLFGIKASTMLLLKKEVIFFSNI